MTIISTDFPPQTSGNSPSSAGSSASHWQQYFELLVSKGVSETARPWYVRHVEALVSAFPGRGLRSLTTEEITDYLRGLAKAPDQQT